jgi:hypothetical protein
MENEVTYLLFPPFWELVDSLTLRSLLHLADLLYVEHEITVRYQLLVT